MINKVHSRGGGGGGGPIDYLLGKDRQREGAKLLRGDPEQLIELVDSLKFSRKYTSGVLSFAEKDITEADKQKIMDGLEECLLPGLDADQYSVVWVEHLDKGRLELNYVFANVELQSGKRLQPYYDAADRKRVNAWQETIRYDHQLADPNDPARRRALSTPGDLPRDKKQAAEVITAGLMEQMKAGGIKDRAGVVQALEQGGFEVVRQVKGSISIKDPSGGKNLRLSGAIYERDFKFSAELSDEIRAESSEYRRGAGERVSAARREYEKHIERKREYLAARFGRPSSPDAAFRAQDVGMAGLDRSAVAGLDQRPDVVGREHPSSGRSEHHAAAADAGITKGRGLHVPVSAGRETRLLGTAQKRERGDAVHKQNRPAGDTPLHKKKTGESVNERYTKAHTPSQEASRETADNSRETGLSAFGTSAGGDPATHLYRLRARQANQILRERRGRGLESDREPLQRTIQQIDRVNGDDVRAVRENSHGDPLNGDRSTTGIISRIRDVAERAIEATQSLTERAKEATGAFYSHCKRLAGAAGELEQTQRTAERASVELEYAGQHVVAIIKDVEQTQQQKQREQQQAKTVKPSGFRMR